MVLLSLDFGWVLNWVPTKGQAKKKIKIKKTKKIKKKLVRETFDRRMAAGVDSEFYSTKYVTKPGDSAPSKIDRKCKRNYQYIDVLEFDELVQDAQQNFCVTDTVYEDGVAALEWECYCYSDQCNVAANDGNLPKQMFEYTLCKSEVCTPSGCTNVMPSGVCKGQFCINGKKRFFFKFCIISKHFF